MSAKADALLAQVDGLDAADLAVLLGVLLHKAIHLEVKLPSCGPMVTHHYKRKELLKAFALQAEGVQGAKQGADTPGFGGADVQLSQGDGEGGHAEGSGVGPIDSES